MRSLTGPRQRIIGVLNAAGTMLSAKQAVLNEFAEVEHALAEAVRIRGELELSLTHAEKWLNLETTRADEIDEVLEAVERVLHDSTAPAAQQALRMIARSKPKPKVA